MTVKTRKAPEAQFSVTGSKGTTYNVTIYRDGSGYCTCPAWRFQHVSAQYRTCKHINEVHLASK
jgi:predicted nucleic acid-binding Zn finger protein